MHIQGLGECKPDPSYECLASEYVKLPILGGHMCRLLLEGYAEDEAKSEIDQAIANFLSEPFEVLDAAAPYVYLYYLDIKAYYQSQESDFPVISSPAEIWSHVELGNEAYVSRRTGGDTSVYISLECNCAWEPEHGLQIVFKDGKVVNKVGPFDGHLTNSDAYAKAELENVIYRPLT